MTNNAFIEAARGGRNEFWRYLVTVLLSGALVLSSGLCIGLGLVLATGNPDLFALPETVFLGFNLLPFGFILIGVWMGMALLHKRRFFSLINPLEGRFNWRRFWLSAGLWLALAAASDGILSLLQPGNYVFAFDPARFLPFLLVALLLFPVQIAAEEVLFRGYLTQGFGRMGGFWLAWLAPSILFALLHGANPEVGEFGVWTTLPAYLIIGLLLGWVTLRSESLELALGLHLANNLYSALVITFPGSALPAPALFTIQRVEPVTILVSAAAGALIYLALLGLLGRGFFRKGLLGTAVLGMVLLLAAWGGSGGASEPGAARMVARASAPQESSVSYRQTAGIPGVFTGIETFKIDKQNKDPLEGNR
jgi:uncharacterized protein